MKLRRATFAGTLIFMVAITVEAQQPVVWTEHNSNTRLGNNNLETVLTPANVTQAKFGKLFSYPLNDETYSQPLYIPNVTLTVGDKKAHNIVVVTTVSNTVYAWDADSSVTNGGQPLWTANLTPSGATVPNTTYYNQQVNPQGQKPCGGNYNDFAGNVGMVGTPVIDAANFILYVVAHTIESGANVQRLYAIDITSGATKLSTQISGSYQGSSFDPLHNNQRPALALVNGTVYVGWSSYCDWTPYHGWVMGFRTSDLKQVSTWSTTPSGAQAGFWQSGQGVMADAAGNLYVLTGNGTANLGNNYGESAVRLSPVVMNSPTVSSFFTATNYLCLNNADLDIGSSGLIFLPGTDIVPGAGLVVGGGKEGVLYLMQSNNLGGYTNNGSTCSPQGDKVVQEFQAIFPTPGNATMHIHGSPVFYYSGTHEYVYVWGENDSLRTYEFFPGSSPHFNSTAVAASTMRAPQQVPPNPPYPNGGMPGGFMSISSNGTTNGIVWALTVYACNANQQVSPGILYAFDASNFTGSGSTQQLKELWDSRQNGNRDDVGYFAKFTYPTVANGKVYAGGWGPVSPLQSASQTPCPAPGTATLASNWGWLSVYGPLQGTSVSLANSFNRKGIVTNGTTFSGGLDNLGFAYSANLLGTALTVNGASFSFGTLNASNAVSSSGQTITLPAGQFSALGLLATGVNGNQQSQVFKVTYSDSTSSSFTQSLSDWFTPQSYSGESIASTMAYRDSGNGTTNNGPFHLYNYNFNLNSGKTVQSITLPNNNNVAVLAITLH